MANCVTDETDKRTHREAKYRSIKFKSRKPGRRQNANDPKQKVASARWGECNFLLLHALATHAAFVRKRQLYTNKRGKEKNYTNYTQTLHLTLHSADLPRVTKCIVCASNYTPTIHKTQHWTQHNGVQNSTLRRSKTYTEPSTEPYVEVWKALPFREGLG